MAIFAVFRVANAQAMSAAIVQHFPTNHVRLNQYEWLVSSPGTAKDVSDRLGISEGATGPAIVFKMASYYGRASTEIWDWIKAKAESSDG